MRKLRWITLPLAVCLVAGLVTAQAPTKPLPTGMLKASPAKGLQAATPNVDYLAPASPAMTGTPTAPTATVGTNTTQIATTAYVLANGGGGGTAYAAGEGIRITPAVGSVLPSLSAGRAQGAPAAHEPVEVYTQLNSTTQDSAYVAVDLSAFVPLGTMSVTIRPEVFSGTGTVNITLAVRPVGFHVGSPNGDGAWIELSPVVAGKYVGQVIHIPLSPDRKIEVKRTNSTGGTAAWYRIQLLAHDGPGPRFGGLQTLVATNQVGHYASFPHCLHTAAGTDLVAYRDGNGVAAVDHSNGGFPWLIRNGGSPTRLFQATDFSDAGISQVQDTFLYAHPTIPTRIYYLIRTFSNVNPDTHDHYYSFSDDEGATWATPLVRLPNIAAFSSAYQFQFFDFLANYDVGKIYATVYGVKTGEGAGQSVAFCQSTDGITWTPVSWITLASVRPGDETGLVPMPDGRIVAITRNIDNSFNGHTAYSDDRGVTWTPLAQQTGSNLWGAPRGFALSNYELAIVCRNLNGGEWNGLAIGYWILDRSGTVRSPGIHVWNYGNASNGAYCHWMRERDGHTYLYFYSDGNIPGQAPGLFRTLMGFRP